MNNTRFNSLVDKVELFILKDVFRIAALFEVEEKVILDLMLWQSNQDAVVLSIIKFKKRP